ncbi:MAG: glycosyltransferase family 4 protein [Anaerohalosphaeraceae bacterium]
METKPLQITILAEQADPARGGAERSVRELTEELNRQGVETTLLTAAGTPDGRHTQSLFPDSSVKRIPLSRIEAALGEYLKTHPCSLLHSTLPVRGTDVYQPRGGSWKQAVLQHAQSYPDPIRRFLKKRLHFLNRRRTRYLRAEQRLLTTDKEVVVAALSESVKTHFIRHYNLPPQRIAVIPNGIRLPEAPAPETAADFRSRLLASAGLNPSAAAAVFLFAANNFRLKGLYDFITPFADAVRKSPVPLLLVIAGRDNPRRARNLAWLAGIEKNLIFTGPLPNLTAALAAADAAVLPTWYDPSSRFILEAIAIGKPVLTTALNGASDFIQSGRHGILVEHPRCRRQITDGLLQLADAKIRAAFAQAVLEDNLREQVSITRHVRQLISLYKQILTRKNTSL